MLERGSVIGGKYRLDEQVGTGGTATVWRAVHTELNRPLAVKFLNVPGREPEKVRELFLEEARLAASVRHRNVVDIIDFGTTDDGVPYMVMELLEGTILVDRLIDGPPLHVGEFIRIMADVLTGLSAVHDAGIVHRDLKPENVFLVRDSDGSIYPKLLDFGISRIDHNMPTSTRSSAPTMDGLIVGTPHYMSPEQARGLRDVDYRTDIYAVGVLLYEGLAGQLPFDSENPGDLIVMVTTQVATPLGTLRPELGQAISDVIERAMARARDARWRSALEMRHALLEAAERTALIAPTWGVATARSRAHELETLGEASVDLPTELPRSRGGLALWLTAGIAAIGAAVGIGLSSQNGGASETRASEGPAAVAAPAAPEAEDTVRVRLHGVPPTGGVRVDGVPVSGSEVVLPRDGRMRSIEVTESGRSVWRVAHAAIAHGEYDVTAESEAEAPAATAERAAPARAAKRPRGARRAARRAAPMAEMEAAPTAESGREAGQFTDPGF